MWCTRACRTGPTVTLLMCPWGTGLPKAAIVTQERVWAASFIMAVSGITSDDVMYINLPLYHSAGFLIGMCGSIERGNIYIRNIFIIIGG